jgi:hypothetical protein
MTTHLHLKKLNRTKHVITVYFREHENRHEFSLGSFSTVNMMQDVLFVLTRQSSQNSELAPVAWHIRVSPYNNLSWSSRCLLSDIRTRLVYLQKITEHIEPFMPALMKASTYITVHYRNGIRALSRCMDSVQPRTFSVWMEDILTSHERHAELLTYETRGKTQLINIREDGIRGMDHSINPRNSRDAEQHTYKTRGS